MQPFLEETRSKLRLFSELILFAVILILIPIQFPSLLTRTHFSFSHWFYGPETATGNAVIWAYMSDILTLIFALWSIHKWKNVLTDVSSLSLALFIGVASFTLYYSPLPLEGGSYKLFNLYLLFFLFQITRYLLRDDGIRKIHFFFLVILMIMLFEGGLAIKQYFSQSLVGLNIFEPYPLSISDSPVTLKQLWSLDSFFGIERPFTTILRPYGTLTHANTLGGFLFFCSLIPFYFFYIVRKAWVEVVLAVLIFFQFFTICITYSRASLFGYLLMTGFWFLVCMLKVERTKEKVKKLMRLGGYALTSIMICFFLFYSQFTERGGIVNYNDFVSAASDIQRVQSTYTALMMFMNHLFTGVGLEHYPNYIGETLVRLGPKYAGDNLVIHNIYLLIATETGLFGILLFLFFIGSIIWKTLRNLNPLTITLLSTFIGLLLLGLVDFYLWRHPGGRLMFIIAAGFISAFSEKKKETAQEPIPAIL